MGFSKEQLLVIPINSQNLQAKIESLKQDLLTNPNILSASATSDLPGKLLWISSINYEGQSGQSSETMTYLEIDKDFVKTYGMQMKEGYLPGDPASPYSEFISPERVCGKKNGWEQPIGKMFGGGYIKKDM
jgi:putative ABC transport system permease protein